MIPSKLEQLANAFWDRIGEYPHPPRDLEAVLWKLGTVWVRDGHPITPRTVHDRFRQRGITLPASTTDDRPLLGLLIAHRGQAEIAVDSTLSPPFRRMIVAHEFAHFLAEYLAPRERILRRLGPSVLPILDGDRPATDTETLAGALAGVHLGVHWHGLERGFDPTHIDDHRHSERIANELGLELLAPWRMVVTDVCENPSPTVDAVQNRLVNHYGLPADWAPGYARRVVAWTTRHKAESTRWGL